MIRIEQIKSLCEAAITQTRSCPFCDVLPQKGLTQKTGCQLHGDPIQYVTVFCNNKKCPARPSVKGIVCRYNGGDKPDFHAEATMSAFNEWNKRANSELVPELIALVEEMAGALELCWSQVDPFDTPNEYCEQIQAALAAYKAFNSEVV